MKIQEEDYGVFKQFLQEIYAMASEVEPFLLAFGEDSERREIEEKVIHGSYRLYHSIKGTGSFLHLNNIVSLAQTYEYMLDLVRSERLILQPSLTRLLVEGVNFLKQSVGIMWKDKSDARLSGETKKLSAAVMQTTGVGHNSIKFTPAGSTPSPQQELLETFVEETRGLLETAEQEFVLWDYVAIDTERVTDLCKIIGLLKNNYTMFDLEDLERICRAMEATLLRFVDGDFFQGPYPEQVFIRIIDTLRETTDRFLVSGEAVVPNADKHLLALQGLIRRPIGELLVQAGLVASHTIDEALEKQKVTESQTPPRLGEVLVEMGEISEIDIHHILDVQHQQREKTAKLNEQLAGEQRKRVRGEWADLLSAELTVERSTINKICELVRTLAIEYRSGEIKSEPLVELEKLCRTLQRVSANIIVPRLKRVVHDLAIKTNKKVFFSVKGAGGEVDGDVITALYEPLVELLTNSIEHGLEFASKREEQAKKAKGNLRLLFLQKADELWVSVEDDGCGFDIGQLTEIAARRGLLSAEKKHLVSNRDIAKLVIQEKLSTKKQTGGSFEGELGLEIVQQALERLQGKVDILSLPGKGTRVTLHIPHQH